MRLGTAYNFKVDALFSRAKYDFETDKNHIFELLERPYFRQVLTDLAGRDLFLTAELCFELEQNVNNGFPWHVGAQSFGFQPANEFACTLWAPLHPVDAKGQRGGMAYVPQHVVAGGFVFEQIERAVVSTLEAKEQAGIRTSINDYFALRNGVLNSPTMVDILENHEVEDDFEPGDVLVFNKQVVHRSIMLGDGDLTRRVAYVLRFVDAESHYDLQRAQTLEYPVERYGKGLFPYRAISRQHIEIAEAGGKDGDLLSECAYFNDPDRRMLRRHPSRSTA